MNSALPNDIFADARLHRLDNGLTVCICPYRRTPVVATAVVYRAGRRDEPAGMGGIAHFLEHMMFKGAKRFGAGAIDRQTRALGGINNAYTGHDATLYYFTFAADRWQIALDIEADRMSGLLLDPEAIEAERQVILEEIAMYEGEPWDVLDETVQRTFFGAAHPYGCPVLGSRQNVAAIDRRVLSSFHHDFYGPENATVTVIGDVDPQAALREVKQRFDLLKRRREDSPRQSITATPPQGAQHIERHQGEVARLLLAMPAPAATAADHPKLRLLMAVLGTGRSSRLHRALVDDGQLCIWVSADITENLDASCSMIAAEVIPGTEPRLVQDEIVRQLQSLIDQPPTAEEVARAKQMILADWLFANEKVEQQAFLLGNALTLFDLQYPHRYLCSLLRTEAAELADIAARYLDSSARAVFGWSLPRPQGETAEQAEPAEVLS